MHDYAMSHAARLPLCRDAVSLSLLRAAAAIALRRDAMSCRHATCCLSLICHFSFAAITLRHAAIDTPPLRFDYYALIRYAD